MSSSPSFSEWPDVPWEPMSVYRREYYRQAAAIALDYFNSDNSQLLLDRVVGEAFAWTTRYFGSCDDFVSKRPTGLLKVHPDLFNLGVSSSSRLRVAEEPAIAALEHGDDNDDVTEPFPDYEEPTLATEAELDEIVDLVGDDDAALISAQDLGRSAILSHLPEFVAQLGTVDFSVKRALASGRAATADECHSHTRSGKQLSTPHARSSICYRLPGGSIFMDDAWRPPSPSSSSSSNKRKASEPRRPLTKRIKLVRPKPTGAATPRPSEAGGGHSRRSTAASTGGGPNPPLGAGGGRRIIKIRVPEKRPATTVMMPTPPATPSPSLSPQAAGGSAAVPPMRLSRPRFRLITNMPRSARRAEARAAARAKRGEDERGGCLRSRYTARSH